MAADSSWLPATLGQHVEILTGFPFQSARYTTDSAGIALLRGDNVIQGRFRWDDVKRWPPAEMDALLEYLMQPGDVVLAMDRPWIEAGLKYAAVTEHDIPCLLVQRVARLRARPSLDQGFLRYLIGSAQFTEHILGVQTGTAVPHISANQIREYRFLRPPLTDQHIIARILGALDDKIELNRRMNATLESMASALFKSWFVDFDPTCAKVDGRQPAGIDTATGVLFPDEFEESVMGPIPLGWDVRSLDTIATFLNGLALQKYPPHSDEDWLPVIKIAELHRGNTDSSDRASTALEPQYIVEDGDVLFSWSGSLEVVVWCGGPGALNQHLFKVTSTDFPKWLFYQWIHHHLPDFRAIAAGKATTMGHIQRHHLTEALVVVPPKTVIESMNAVMQPLFDQVVNNNLESRTLATIRDTLLPKLLSGEVRVKAAEGVVAGSLA